MKYLENFNLEQLSSYLSNKAVLGGRLLNARIEAYSTKKAGDDKKQSKLLEQKLSGTKSTVKLLIDLIQTLNASLIDYDFSSLTAESFCLIPLSECLSAVNSHLAELTSESPSFLSVLWKNINDCIALANCEVYCLSENPFNDSNEEGVVWSFFYFLYNKELKRICLFACTASGITRYGIMLLNTHKKIRVRPILHVISRPSSFYYK